MNEKSYENWTLLSDESIEQEIGKYVKKVRQQQNKTQDEIAKAANISRSTLSLLERGESGNLKTLIRVLRVLDKLKALEVFSFKEVLSPLVIAKAKQKPRMRVRTSKVKGSGLNKKNSNW